MDVRRATWYYKWKGGVEVQLYEFQLAQSTPRHLVPCAERNAPAASLPDSQYQVPAHAWEELDFLQDDLDNPLDDCSPIKHPLVVPKAVVTPAIDRLPPPTVRPTELALCTPAVAFMRERPAGPRQTSALQMKALERRVSAQVQRKSTTTPAGRRALADISAMTQAGNHKATITQPRPTKKMKGSRKVSAKPTKGGTAKQRNKGVTARRTPTQAMIPVVDNMGTAEPVCTYGCTHGGLVGLKQMMPYDTKFCLEKGNYFHSKCCVDCNASIAEVFGASKNKALVYYCPIDYNVDNLSDDNAAIADTPCACILCITCYIGREEKKTATSGKGTRSSRRGRRN